MAGASDYTEDEAFGRIADYMRGCIDDGVSFFKVYRDETAFVIQPGVSGEAGAFTCAGQPLCLSFTKPLQKGDRFECWEGDEKPEFPPVYTATGEVGVRGEPSFYAIDSGKVYFNHWERVQ